MKKFFILFLTLVTAILVSCEKDSTQEKVSLTVETAEGNNPTVIPVKGKEYSEVFTIVTNGTWRVEKPQSVDWITIAPGFGQGNGTVTISAPANPETSSRRALLTFYLNDTKYHAVTIKQEPETYFIEVEPEAPENIPAQGGDIVLTISSNIGNWEYAIKGENSKWLTEKSKNATSVTFTAEKSAVFTEQTATVEFTVPDYPDLKQTVVIKQDAQKPPFLTIEPATPDNIPGKGGDVTLTISTNLDEWDCTIKGENSQWLTEKSRDATSVTFTAERNSLATQQTAIVAFSAPGYPEIKPEITVKQDEKEPPVMTIDPETPAAISAKGGDVTLKVTTNAGNWTYKIEGTNTQWLSEKASNATSVTLTAGPSTSTSDQKATITFTSPNEPELVKQVEIVQTKLAADVLDVVFNLDGTATDASPMQNTVENFDGPAKTLYYNDVYERYVARYDHPIPPASISNGYYKVSYASNKAFQDALSNGHTLETVMMYNGTFKGAEAKWFSSHEGGGTGFLLTSNNNGEIAFIPNMSTGGWQWTRSGIVPEQGKYYHVVGILDLTNMKSQIYVNGELKASVDVKGTFKFPNATSCYWFGIGGDASPTTATNGWNGEIAVARIYDDPLTADQVKGLWQDFNKNK